MRTMRGGFLAGLAAAALSIDIDAGAMPSHRSASVLAPSARKALCVSRSTAGRAFFAHALAAERIEARVGGPELMPDTLQDLIPYDCVILSNIPRSALGDDKMRMLTRYVRDYGGGLVVLGGPGSLGSAYRGTPLEEMLPAMMGGGERFSTSEALPLCVVLLIDKSGSMAEGFGGKLLAAQRAAEELVEQLQANDRVGIISFDALFRVLVPLRAAGDAREEIVAPVRGIVPGGDTRISGPLEEALRQMEDSACRVKHVVLITDGMTRDLKEYDYRGLVSEYVHAGVSISATGVGPDGASFFLRALTEGTGGDYHHVTDLKTLPLVVIRDVRKAMMESGLIKECIVAKPDEKSPLLRGVGRGEIPEVAGYVIMTAKPGADVALYTDVRGEKDPLLAAWRRGRGKTVVWTSDVEGRWSGGAASAKKSEKFWMQVIRWSLRDREHSL